MWQGKLSKADKIYPKWTRPHWRATYIRACALFKRLFTNNDPLWLLHNSKDDLTPLPRRPTVDATLKCIRPPLLSHTRVNRTRVQPKEPTAANWLMRPSTHGSGQVRSRLNNYTRANNEPHLKPVCSDNRWRTGWTRATTWRNNDPDPRAAACISPVLSRRSHCNNRSIRIIIKMKYCPFSTFH